MSFLEWLKLENSKDPDNILPPGLDFEKAIYFLKDYLLGEDWYVSYSGSAKQITTDIVYDILKKYSKKFRKELKTYEKRVNNERKWRNGRTLIGNKKWLEEGYSLYLYFNYKTSKYEWNPIDPDFYSNIAFEDFRNNHTANNKLYDNIEDILKDREELNSSFEKL